MSQIVRVSREDSPAVDGCEQGTPGVEFCAEGSPRMLVQSTDAREARGC